MNNEKSLTIVLETIYNLGNDEIEIENAKLGVVKIFGDIWRDKAFENTESAFIELDEYINSMLDKGAEQLTEEERDEVNRYFNIRFLLIQKGSYPKSFKIGSIAHMYTVRTIKVSY